VNSNVFVTCITNETTRLHHCLFSTGSACSGYHGLKFRNTKGRFDGRSVRGGDGSINVKPILSATGLSLVLGLGSMATVAYDDGYDGSYYGYARVLQVEPIVEMAEVVEPRERCWDERVTHYESGRPDSYAPVIAGGVVGGVIGSRFGQGKGKDAATVAGTLLGASIARDLSHQQPGQVREGVRQRCEEVEERHQQEHIAGYRVRYRYDGHDAWTRTDREPGDRLRVRVSVQPAE
jgi:uncharacterized protein YcfJ